MPPQLVYRDWLSPPFKHASVGRGSMPVRALRAVESQRRATHDATLADAQRLVDRNDVIGLLLLEKDGTVLFEAYKQGATAGDKMIGYSMSKSATSIAIGQALCDGLIGSLDDRADRYSPVLQGTAYGAATLRQLLTMSSGGKKSVTVGEPVAGSTTSLFRHQTSTIRQGFSDHGGSGADASTPGRFEYKSFDTYALGVVVADAAKAPFPEYFSRAVWQKIGAQADAAWLLDRNGDTATALGFGAVLRDWGRLALFVHDQVAQGGADSCLARYLRKATSTRIANDMTRIGQAHRGYGYQFWTDNWIARGPNFWMMGYGGQRIAIDPASGRVMVLVASVEDFMPDVYRLFNRWIN